VPFVNCFERAVLLTCVELITITFTCSSKPQDESQWPECKLSVARQLNVLRDRGAIRNFDLFLV
jgi:hypothetical protein